jgi:hypothetical protein
MPGSKVVKPTESEEAKAAYMAAMRKWSTDVINASKSGKLDKLVGPAYDKIPFMGGILYEGRKRSWWGDKIEPEDQNIIEGSQNVLFNDVYDRARSTFTDELVKRLEKINPKPSDDANAHRSYAVRGRLGIELADRLRTKLQSDYAGPGEGFMSPKETSDLINQVVGSDKYRNYEKFMYRRLQDPNQTFSIKDSDFNPMVYMRPELEAFLSGKSPDSANYKNSIGTGDISPTEIGVKGLDPDVSQKLQDYWDTRSKEVNARFDGWVSKGAK